MYRTRISEEKNYRRSLIFKEKMSFPYLPWSIDAAERKLESTWLVICASEKKKKWCRISSKEDSVGGLNRLKKVSCLWRRSLTSAFLFVSLRQWIANQRHGARPRKNESCFHVNSVSSSFAMHWSQNQSLQGGYTAVLQAWKENASWPWLGLIESVGGWPLFTRLFMIRPREWAAKQKMFGPSTKLTDTSTSKACADAVTIELLLQNIFQCGNKMHACFHHC